MHREVSAVSEEDGRMREVYMYSGADECAAWGEMKNRCQ